jgi:hypothetical protein
MPIAHLFGLTPTHPFATWRRVTLAHPAVAHSLLISVFPGAEGYKSSLRDWQTSDGRSLTGGVRVKGAGYKPPEEWQISATVTRTMIQLFEILLATQNSTAAPVTLVDEFERTTYIAGATREPAWLAGYPVTSALGYPEGYAAYNVWLDVDADYKTFLTPDRYLLQFQALQA